MRKSDKSEHNRIESGSTHDWVLVLRTPLDVSIVGVCYRQWVFSQWVNPRGLPHTLQLAHWIDWIAYALQIAAQSTVFNQQNHFLDNR